MSFEWRTDEDEVWQETVTPSWPQRRTYKVLRWMVPLIIIFALGIWIARQQVQRYIATREAEIKADVLSAVELLVQAEESQDIELFRSMLASGNESWNYGRTLTFAEGLQLHRPYPGWQMQQRNVAIELDPTFSVATAVITQTYTLPDAIRVNLAHQLEFKRAVDRWLYVAPAEAHWGEKISMELAGRRVSLTMISPETDQAEALQLAEFLLRAADAYCVDQLNCSEPISIELELLTTPQSIPLALALDDPPNLGMWTCCQLILQLPAISLIGVPTDEQSRAELYRYLATLTVSAMNRQLVGGRTYGRTPLDHALFGRQLVELDLPLHYVNVDVVPIAYIADYEELWRESLIQPDGEAIGQATHLFSFLEQTMIGSPTAVELQQSLKLREVSKDVTFSDWLLQTTGVSSVIIQSDWENYITQQGQVSETVSLSDTPSRSWRPGYSYRQSVRHGATPTE